MPSEFVGDDVVDAEQPAGEVGRALADAAPDVAEVEAATRRRSAGGAGEQPLRVAGGEGADQPLAVALARFLLTPLPAPPLAQPAAAPGVGMGAVVVVAAGGERQEPPAARVEVGLAQQAGDRAGREHRGRLSVASHHGSPWGPGPIPVSGSKPLPKPLAPGAPPWPVGTIIGVVPALTGTHRRRHGAHRAQGRLACRLRS